MCWEGAEPDNEARKGLGPLASHGGQQHICMTVIFLWRWVKSLTGKCNECWLIAHTHAQAYGSTYTSWKPACLSLCPGYMLPVLWQWAVNWSHVSSDLAFSSWEIVCRESFVSREGSMLWCVQPFLHVKQQPGWKRGNIWFQVVFSRTNPGYCIMTTWSVCSRIRSSHLTHKWGSERFRNRYTVNSHAARQAPTPHGADSGSWRTDGDLCPAVRSVIFPPES